MSTVLKLSKDTDISRKNVRFSIADYPTHYIFTIHSINQVTLGHVLRGHQIVAMYWRVLAILQEDDGVNVSYLANRLSIDKSNLSRTLEAMFNEGLVDRHVPKNDRRNVLLYLTEAGRQKFEEAYPDVMACIEATMEGFSESEKKTFLKFLQRMKDNALRMTR